MVMITGLRAVSSTAALCRARGTPFIVHQASRANNCTLLPSREYGLIAKSRYFTSMSGNKEEAKVEKKDGIIEERKEEKKAPGKIKQFWLKYGVVGLCTYVGVYSTTFGSLFTGMYYDILPIDQIVDPEVALEYLKWGLNNLQLQTHIDIDSLDHEHSKVVMAWAATEFLEIPRIGATVFLTGLISRSRNMKQTAVEEPSLPSSASSPPSSP